MIYRKHKKKLFIKQDGKEVPRKKTSEGQTKGFQQ